MEIRIKDFSLYDLGSFERLTLMFLIKFLYN